MRPAILRYRITALIAVTMVGLFVTAGSAGAVPTRPAVTGLPGLCARLPFICKTVTRTTTTTQTFTSTALSTILATVTVTNVSTVGGATTATVTEATTVTTTATSLTSTGTSVSATFIATQDAWVESANPDTNHGTASLRLLADQDPQRESYVAFVVSGLTGNVTSAVLRLRSGTAIGSDSAQGIEAYATSSSWDEATITWNTGRPARTTGSLDESGAFAADQWVELDVTSAVTGNGTFSFNVAALGTDGAEFSSREGTFPPELVIIAAS